jgi:hypothetical protein
MIQRRVPDFIIIGAQKSATSSLYWWLQDQREFFLASPKETNFFSFEKDWSRGAGWYSDQFSSAHQDAILGEASVSYSYASTCVVSAERMSATVPGARLIYVIRHPIERLRSHYRHEVQRNREKRPLRSAILEPGNAYVGNSRYFTCLRPYTERFPRDQICVVRFEDLVQEPHTGWSEILRFLGVPDRPAPSVAANVTRENGGWSPAMRWLKEKRILRFSTVGRLPQPVRKIGRRLLIRDGVGFEQKLAASRASIPDEITDEIWEDVARLEGWLGLSGTLWPRPERPSEVRSRP